MKRTTKLGISIILDLLGLVSYVFPFFGEMTDILFAPLQAWWIYKVYGSKKGAMLGFVEEILPFSDIIPSCTIMHFVSKKEE